MNASLDTLLSSRLNVPAPSAVVAMAEHIRKNHTGVCAVLAYGAALRDNALSDTLIDLYVLTESNSGISANSLSRLACMIIPPNVYYAEFMHEGTNCRAKYAVLPLSQLAAKVRPTGSNPYFWARFSQPTRLVWSGSKEIAAEVQRVIAAACATACANAIATSPGADPAQQWASLFRETYRTELRPESADRASAIVEADRAYYESLSEDLKNLPAVVPNWTIRRIAGKTLSIIRLVKAAFTFQGGADYIAWKIKRHSGVDIQVTDFQRRHPLLAGIILLPQLLRKGAVR